MIYKSFILDKYKGIDSGHISTPLEIRLQKGKAVALIGINECGKSTILKVFVLSIIEMMTKKTFINI